MNNSSLTAEARAQNIRCVIFDVDGVMTDGKLYLTHDGEEIKTVNVRDGLGIRQLLKHGIDVAVISGRPSAAMQKRLEHLGVPHIWLQTEDKLPAYETLKAQLNLTDEQMAHMGDDLPDLPLLAHVGLALAPGDAHPKAKAAAHWLSAARAGDGAVREAVDFILEAQGKG
jgi:3-deoxy-D-manno-octulosonate 8-phosphate phosphatase (KDO 8-P phosphatase)